MSGMTSGLARLAGILCGRADFQRWVMAQPAATALLDRAPVLSREGLAAQFVRQQCGVSSRAQLDRSDEAAALFHLRVRRPFLSWLAGQHR